MIDNISTLELWLFIQMGLETLLVIMMIVFLVKIRRLSRKGPSMPEDVQEAVQRFITQSEKLSAAFSQTLEEKKEISVNLLLKLEHKINEMNTLLEKAEKGLQDVQQQNRIPAARPEERSNPATPENRALVVKLAEKGLSVEEIARKARLHRGEVELILDLEKQLKL